MTLLELINELEQYDESLPVIFRTSQGEIEYKHHIYYEHDAHRNRMVAIELDNVESKR